FIDGTLMDNVIGEVSLTIRYKGTVVDLEKVAVVRGMLYPLLLGIEWIVKSDAMIKGVEGVAKVIMPSELSVGQNCNVKKIEQGRPADTQNSVRESSTIEQEIDSEYVQVTEELKTMGAILGTEVSAASSDPLSETTFVLEPVPSKRVMANSMGYFKCKVPKCDCKLWMVSTAGALGATGGWVTPSCVLEAGDGILTIPVINANPHPIGRRAARAILKATPIEENDIHLLPDSRDIGEEIVGMVQPHDDTSQPDDTLNDVTIDPRLTPLEVDKLWKLLCDHRQCFSRKKGHTHLAKHFIHTGSAKPIYCAPYHVLAAERKLINDHVD
ncbi:Uncharacterized protein APZ42_001357, partial [Daphnia magna]